MRGTKLCAVFVDANSGSERRIVEYSSTLAAKRVVVTGADRGIGLHIARHFLRLGAAVCSNVFQPPDRAAQHAGCSTVFQADVRDPLQIESLFAHAEATMGGVDVLINNAGVESIVPAIDLSVEEWERVQQTDLRGAFFCAQAAARRMRSQGTGGVILNISSIHESVPRLGAAHYSIAKAGVAMLTKSLAIEWAEFGIRVVGISPGAIETEINREQIDAFGRNRFEEWIPLGRIGSVEDVARAAAFLVSGDAAYVSGTTLTIDGAYSLSTIRYDPRRAEK